MVSKLTPTEDVFETIERLLKVESRLDTKALASAFARLVKLNPAKVTTERSLCVAMALSMAWKVGDTENLKEVFAAFKEYVSF